MLSIKSVMFLKKFADALLIERKINKIETNTVFDFIKYYCSIFQAPLAEATMSLELEISQNKQSGWRLNLRYKKARITLVLF